MPLSLLAFVLASNAQAESSVVFRSEAQLDTKISSEQKRSSYSLTLTHTADTFFHVYDALSSSRRPTFANLTSIALESNSTWLSKLSSQMTIEGLGIQTSSALSALMPMQSTSNIAASNGFVIYQAFVTQELPKGASFSLGVFEFNESFYNTDASTLFMNGTFGVGAEMTSSTLSQVPTFPTTSLGAKMRSPIVGPFSIDVGAMNANPAAVDSPLFRRFQLRSSDRVLGVAQANADFDIRENHGTASLGTWGVQSFDVSKDRAPERGGYLLLSQKIYSPRRRDSEGLYGFFRSGIAWGSTFVSDRTVSAGVSYRGLLLSDARDELGIAAAWAHRSKSQREIVEEEGGTQSFHAHETVAEICYRIEIVKGLSVQPDIQLSRHAQFAYNNVNQVAFSTRIQGQF